MPFSFNVPDACTPDSIISFFPTIAATGYPAAIALAITARSGV